MRGLVGLIAAAATVVALAAPGDVVELTADNFDRLTGDGTWMVAFVAPWCGHCKTLKPHYAEAAKRMKDKVRFGSVDATVHRSLAMRFGVNGYPTLFHVSHGANGVEVRRAPVAHNAEALEHFARQGWKTQSELLSSPTSSPYGVVGSIKFYAVYGLEKVVALLEPIATRFGIPLVVVQFTALLLAVMALSMGLIAISVWIGPPKPRRYTAADLARPHAD